MVAIGFTFIISAVISGIISAILVKLFGGKPLIGFIAGLIVELIPPELYSMIPFGFTFLIIPIVVETLIIYKLGELSFVKALVVSIVANIIAPFIIFPLISPLFG
jgi:hypothetical protein